MTTVSKALLLSAGVSAALMAGSATAAGRFVHVEGSVNVRDAASAVRAVRAGERINAKETVVIGEGRAQIRFDDGGWMALQPRTVFEVKEYPQREDGNIVFSLLKGGARAVTGVFSTRRPANYRMETPTATIGIRGTSFQAALCLQSCDVPDGLYVTGGDGTTFVKNALGEIDLARGRTAFVASAQTPPRESNVKPIAEVEGTMTVQQIASVVSTMPGELRPGNYVYFEGNNGYVQPFRDLGVSSAGAAAAISGSLGVAGSGRLFEMTSGSASGVGIGAVAGTAGTSNSGESLTVVFDALNRPVSLTLVAHDGARASITALKAPEFFGADGALYWGRWTDTTFQVDAQKANGTNGTGQATVPAGSFLHYMVGTPAGSVPMSGSATYTFIGGSGSSAQGGSIGAGVTAGSLTANFGANTVTGAMTINHGGVFSASGTAQLDAQERARFVGNSGSASGPGGSFPFRFDGFFAGAGAPTAPASAGTAWKIDRPDPIVGTAGFRCASGC